MKQHAKNITALALAILSSRAAAQTPKPTEQMRTSILEEVVVTGRDDDLTGVATTANEGVVGQEQLATRPILRAGEVVETIPGVIVTQHAGGGKANQYFLRGFNLDHGTDLATWLDGMPVNMRTHAHGQGYTDLNILIPELVREVGYKKGPYFADEGDFASAGAFRIRMFDVLPQSQLSLGGGTLGYARAFYASSPEFAGGHLLHAIEMEHTDGPWKNPDDFQKLNLVLRYSRGDDTNGWSLTAMSYNGSWDSSDQAPRRAFDHGLGRYDSLDDTTGGDSHRHSLLWDWRSGDSHTKTHASAYASYYDLDLFSNFTYFLDDPVRGDQFEQHDRRVTIGGQIDQSWKHTLFAQASETTIGLQLRHDDIRNGLYHTQETNRIGTTRSDHTRETSAGIFAQNETRWTPWFRTVAGVRGDWFHFDVENGTGANSGSDEAFIASPKLSLIFGPWRKTEFYVNGGFGFHSNDARGVTARTDAADPLVRTKGAEVGIRTTIIPGLQTSLSAWILDIDSELLFVGDAGTTEAGRPSRRTGIELANFWKPTDWLTVDADLAISRSRFRDDAPEGRNIPGSIKTVASVGISIHDVGPWFGSLRYRYFGPRELIEDGTRQSTGSTLLYAQLGYKINATWTVTADVFNVLNAEVSDIDYYYASRQHGEPAAGVDDYHSHPAEPRSLRVTLTARW